MYDDIAKTFTVNGVVDEQAQRNDLAIVREIAGVTEVVPMGARTTLASRAKQTSN